MKSLAVADSVRDGMSLEEQVSASNPGFKSPNTSEQLCAIPVVCGAFCVVSYHLKFTLLEDIELLQLTKSFYFCFIGDRI